MTSGVETQRPVWRSPKRLLLAAIGIACVGLAIAGAVLPGLPTTIFMILASFAFARSCPWLEQRLFRIRVLRPFVPYVRGERGLPMRARLTALAMMWIAAGTSLLALAAAGRLPVWLATVILAAVGAGSVSVLTWRTGSAQQEARPEA